jgi:hypothetical protein
MSCIIEIKIKNDLNTIKNILKNIVTIIPYNNWGFGTGETITDDTFTYNFKNSWLEWAKNSPDVMFSSTTKFWFYFYFKTSSDAMLFKLRCL